MAMNLLEKNSPIAIGFAFAIASSMLFAIRPIFVKLAYAEGVDPLTLMAVRMAISAPIYAILLIYFLRTLGAEKVFTWQNLTLTAVAGVFGYFAASYLDLLGLQYVSAQLGRMILYMYPTLVVILGAIWFEKPITLRTVVSLLITYLGIAIIFGHDLSEFGPDVITGGILIGFSALSFAIYLLISKGLIDQLGSRIFTSIALISASAGILIYFEFKSSLFAIQMSQPAFIYIAIIAIFCTVIPTFFTTAAVSRIGADRTGITAMIGPGFTSLFAVLILSENFTVFHFTGIVLTIIGVSLLPRD